MTLDLVLSNCRAVLETGVEVVSIGIASGRIAEIALADQPIRGRSEIDVGGRYVLPGGVDQHVHFENPSMGTETAHTFRIGSEAAVLGGTTTFIDFAFQQPGEGLIAAVKRRQAAARSQVLSDYSLHGAMTSPSERALAEIPELVAMGVPSIKFFLTYRSEGWAVSDAQLLKGMEHLSDAGGIACIHAENDELLLSGISERTRLGDVGAGGHARSRPPLLEGEAIQRAALYAEHTGCPLFVVHVSSNLGVAAIREAQNRGVAVFGETCPHYLAFDDSVLDGEGGYRYVMSPPLRPAGNQESLWRALRDGVLESVGSDDAAYYEEYKSRGERDFTQIANGVPGAEVRLPYVVSEGRRRDFTLSQLADLLSTNPAKRFGLYPRKGAIRLGADADLVVYDDELEVRPSVERVHSPIEYSIYGSVTVRGWPRDVLRRGEFVVRDGELNKNAGRGEFIPRTPLHPPST